MPRTKTWEQIAQDAHRRGKRLADVLSSIIELWDSDCDDAIAQRMPALIERGRDALRPREESPVA